MKVAATSIAPPCQDLLNARSMKRDCAAELVAAHNRFTSTGETLERDSRMLTVKHLATSSVGWFLALILTQSAPAQNHVVTTVAGGGADVWDGKPAKSARLYVPWSLTFDSEGNLYVADLGQHRIRKVSPGGRIITIAGTGRRGITEDGGQAQEAHISSPSGIALDKAGNLFFSEWDASKVRKISTDGVLSTVAGTGTAGSRGDGGPAVMAELNGPGGLVFDGAGNLYISDGDAHRVRRITPDGTISTFAGNGQDQTKGDGGPASQASVSSPTELAVDNFGNLYIAETGGGRVRKVNTSGIISTVAGGGKSSPSEGAQATSVVLTAPIGLALNAVGDLFISDAERPRISKVTATGLISTVAGGSGWGYSPDGSPAAQAKIAWPSGLAFDPAGLLHFADSDANLVRRVNAVGNLETVAGNREFGSGQPATDAEIGEPGVPVSDAVGKVYIPSPEQNEVWKIEPSGTITAWVGDGVEMASQNVSSKIAGPNYAALARDGTLYVGSPDSVLQVSPSGAVTQMDQFGLQVSFDSSTGDLSIWFQNAGNLAVSPSGTLYVASQGPIRINKLQGSHLVAVAGTGTAGYSGDGGPAIAAKIGIVEQMVFDPAGNLYFADTDNHRIRKIDTAGIITTVAGNGTRGFNGDGGSATGASLSWPYGITIDPAGNLYIADTGNQRIRMGSPTGAIRTIAGNGVAGFSGDGKRALDAEFNYPEYLCWNPRDNALLVSDSWNRRIRQLAVESITSH
jgi:sugar lactone lactonase YvrE